MVHKGCQQRASIYPNVPRTHCLRFGVALVPVELTSSGFLSGAFFLVGFERDVERQCWRMTDGAITCKPALCDTCRALWVARKR